MTRVPTRLRRALALVFAAAPLGLLSSGALAGDVQQLEPLHAQPASASAGMIDESSHLWFVELQTRPTAAGGNANQVRRDKESFRSAAADSSIRYSERFAFDRLWNGLSVQASAADAGKLAQLSGVKAIYPVVTVSVPDNVEPGAVADLATALAMTGADIAQTGLGLSGQGIRVAVMDTGIDYDHPDLGGCFGPGCRVEAGWDFVGNDFNADATSPAYNPVPVPGPDPDDCNGHGTHVAGIVGASAAGPGGVTGVAPEVTFGAYKVFGCAGSTTADIMVAAMERALDDNMDVLNMSIGSAFQWPQYPTAVAASNLVNQGMVVVASIGNSGTAGVYAAGAPGLGEHVIGVASYDNSHANLPYFTIGEHKVGYVPMTFAGPTPTQGSEEIVDIGRACTVEHGDVLLNDPAGKVALAVRGDCGFNEKATAAIDAGAVAVVISNNAPGVFNGTLGEPIDGVTPVVGISQADGIFIRTQDTPVTMTWTDQMDFFPSPTGGLISSFSSYGLSPDLALKPDIGAPGGQINSTYPLESGGYATISGTSMASPHVAGAVALLLEARPDTSAHAVRSILQNSADPKNWWGNPGLGLLDNVHRQGAGMLDIPGAIQSTASVTPGKLSLGESEAGPSAHTLTIHNHGASTRTFHLGHAPALSTGGNTYTPSFFTGFASLGASAASVDVPAGGSATVDVVITANPALGDRSQYGGYITFTDPDSGDVIRVPYAGFKGDYQSVVALVPTQFGFPLLGRATSCIRVVDGACVGGSYSVGGDSTFDMSDVFNQPSVLVHFEHQVQYMEMIIRHADTGAPVHPVFHKTNVFEYLPRNSTPTGFFAFAWDGTRIHSNGRRWEKAKDVPNGDFAIEVRALKALGDANNPDHWESWTSPVFTIARP